MDNIKNSGSQACYYTRFSSFFALKSFYDYLGPAANHLCYSHNGPIADEQVKRCCSRAPPPLEGFFMTMVHLHAGHFEQDIANLFQVSRSTVSRIFCTWINFWYLKLKDIPLWPPRELVQVREFWEKYPTTTVIIDATETFLEQPQLPELQKTIFSNFKNYNTLKALVGISPDGAITFVSPLYPGCIFLIKS